MHTIKNLEDILGLSQWQVRRRVDSLSDLLDKRRGSHNKVLVDDTGVELLKQLQSYRQSGLTNDQAVERIKDELDDQDNAEDSNTATNEALEELVDQLQDQVGELKRDKRRLEERNQSLEERFVTGKTSTGPLGRFVNWLGF